MGQILDNDLILLKPERIKIDTTTTLILAYLSLTLITYFIVGLTIPTSILIIFLGIMFFIYIFMYDRVYAIALLISFVAHILLFYIMYIVLLFS